MKIGIPRGLFFNENEVLWINFFKYLDIDIILSEETNKEILDLGSKYSPDEACLSFKIFIGHVASIKDKVDYVLIPRIDNYGICNQTCTNFLAMYDVVNNLFDCELLNYNINLENKETIKRGLLNIGKKLKIPKKKILEAYSYSYDKLKNSNNAYLLENLKKIKNKGIKILLVGHSYNIHDSLISKQLLDLLKDTSVIYSDLIMDSKGYKNLSSGIYFNYNKNSLNSIDYFKDKVDGIIFLTTFPCGLDSLVNEVVIRKLNKPYLNIIVDENYANTGIETRIESFLSIINKEGIV